MKWIKTEYQIPSTSLGSVAITDGKEVSIFNVKLHGWPEYLKHITHWALIELPMIEGEKKL